MNSGNKLSGTDWGNRGSSLFKGRGKACWVTIISLIGLFLIQFFFGVHSSSTCFSLESGMLTSQGIKIVLEPVEQVDRELFDQTIVILQNRLSNSTYNQSVVEADRVKQEISVMISKKQECYLSKITKFLTQTGELKFYIDGQVVLSAKEFMAVSVELNSEQGYFIGFQLFPNEAKLLARVTQENIGKKMALYLDEDYLMSPVIRAAIESGMVGISLDRDIDKETAINMAALLRGGALPVKLRPHQK